MSVPSLLGALRALRCPFRVVRQAKLWASETPWCVLHFYRHFWMLGDLSHAFVPSTAPHRLSWLIWKWNMKKGKTILILEEIKATVRKPLGRTNVVACSCQDSRQRWVQLHSCTRSAPRQGPLGQGQMGRWIWPSCPGARIFWTDCWRQLPASCAPSLQQPPSCWSA